MPANRRRRERNKKGDHQNSTSINEKKGINIDDANIISKLNECLVWQILNNPAEELGSFTSRYEAEGIVEAVIDSLIEYSTEGGEENSNIDSVTNFMIESLLDYLPDLSKESCTSMVKKVIMYLDGQTDSYKDTPGGSESSEDEEDHANDNNDYLEEDSICSDGSSDDEDNYIQDGECELCERELKLTRHHMIPRSTWPRIRPRFQQAAPYFIEGNMEKAEQILSIGTMPSTLSAYDFSSRSAIKYFLSCYTCSICSICHKMVHKTFDNLDLAENRNSVEKLLEDGRIFKFCKWANKQIPRGGVNTRRHKY